MHVRLISKHLINNYQTQIVIHASFHLWTGQWSHILCDYLSLLYTDSIMISCSSGLFLNSAKVLFTMTDAFLSQFMCVWLMIIINHKVSRSTMNHTAFILGPTFTALCYNIVYNVVKSGEIQHLKLDISTTCVNIVLRENRYGLTFRNISDLGLKKFMKQISLIITNIDRNRTFSRSIECLKLIWGLGKVLWKNMMENGLLETTTTKLL